MKTTNRMVPIIAAIAIQPCLGTSYIWSIFQTGIADSIFGGNNSAASLTFSLIIFFSSIGSVVGGRLAIRHSTRSIVISGGIILATGVFLASLVTPRVFWLLWLTFGIMGGTGMGFMYSTTIACAQKWFPEKKGLITGTLVASIGMGGVIFTPITEALIKHFGGVQIGEQNTFVVLSITFLVICTVSGLFLKDPPEELWRNPSDLQQEIHGKILDMAPGQVLKTPQFYMVTISMMLAVMSGLMMIGFAKPIAVAKGMGATASIGVMVISLFNALGRLLWGMVSDRIGRKTTILIMLAGSGGLALLVNAVEGYYIFVLIGAIGFFYGGFLSNFPAITADLFGAKYMSANYGMVMMGFGLGGLLSSYIAGYYKNLASQDISLMFPAFVIAAVCSGLGFVLMLGLRMDVKKTPR
ncbi:MAG: OFA family MFS transporter [Anaerovoracaceae bacterium]